MSFTYGFYNSLNGDRKYDAMQFGQLFDGIINDGVFMSIGEHLNVTATSGMQVKVGTGRAWFNSTWSYNDTSLLLDVSASSVLLGRIDLVILEVDGNDAVRTNSIKILEGTPSSSPIAPTLTKDDGAKLWQYPLAQINVAAAVTEITQSAITNKVGTLECPFITGVLETIDIDSLVSQWGTQWDEWLSTRTTESQVYRDEQKALFDAWFASMKYILDGDVAGKLQLEIDDLQEVVVSSTLSATGWSGNEYSFETDYPAANYNLYISVEKSATLAQTTAWNEARLLTNNDANVLIASNNVPGIDIPIVIKVVKK